MRYYVEKDGDLWRVRDLVTGAVVATHADQASAVLALLALLEEEEDHDEVEADEAVDGAPARGEWCRPDRAFVDFTVELRSTSPASLGGLPMICGRAAVCGQPAKITANVRGNLVRFEERFAPGAFRATLAARDDTLALINHDVNLLLGRVESGTLRMVEAPSGDLEIEVDPPDTSYARDLIALMGRGDMKKMSVGFLPHPGGVQWNAERTARTITDCFLHDVSVVTKPAYVGTSASIRSDTPSVAELIDLLPREPRRVALRRFAKMRLRLLALRERGV